MAELSQLDVVKILENLDAMTAAHIPEPKRAWAHIFIACALLQKVTPSPQLLTREKFLWACGKVYDSLYGVLRSENRSA